MEAPAMHTAHAAQFNAQDTTNQIWSSATQEIIAASRAAKPAHQAPTEENGPQVGPPHPFSNQPLVILAAPQLSRVVKEYAYPPIPKVIKKEYIEWDERKKNEQLQMQNERTNTNFDQRQDHSDGSQCSHPSSVT